MKDVFEILSQIASDSSKNNKLAILKANKDNADLKAFLKFTYEPRINYYIRALDPKLGRPQHGKVREFDQDLIAEVYDTLACRDLTGNAARAWIANLYHALSSEAEKDLLVKLIQRDVRAGFSVSTINKVWPGLITQVPYMRCVLPKDADLTTWPWAQGIYCQIKADGQFANVSHHGATGSISIESRNGSPYPLEYFNHLIEEAKRHIPEGYQCHGELMIIRNGKLLPRQEGNGVFNSLLQGGAPEAGDEIIYHVWDMIPLTEAKAKNTYTVPYKTRFEALKMALAGLSETSPISVVETYMVYSYKEAMEKTRDVMKRGLEGTIIKHPEGVWLDTDTGSKDVVKLKLEFAVELRVKSLNPGDPKSKHAKTFGSVQMESEDGKLKVGVSGITDKLRLDIFNNFESYYKNAVVTVVANDIMEPSAETGGFFSLFLPRWSDVRLDKTKADTLEQIQKAKANAIDQL